MKKMKIDKSKLKIRLAVKKDINNIVGLYREFSDYHHKLDPDYWSKSSKLIDRFFKLNVLDKKIGKRNSRILLVEFDKNLIGYFIAYYTKTPPMISYVRMGHISHGFIKKDFRKSGIGRIVLEEIFAWFKENKVQIVELDVSIGNELGVNSWRRMGFRESGIRMRKIV